MLVRASHGSLFAALVPLVGCSEPVGTSRVCGGFTLENPVLVLESDRQSSSGLGRLGTDGCLVEVPDVSLGADPSLSMGHGGPFVCARDQGTVLAVHLDPLTIVRSYVAYGAQETKFETSCGPGKGVANPHDADLDASGRLWVARYEQPGIAILGPDGSLEDTVDLSAFADGDGLPEIEAIRVVGDRVYAAVERLDRCGVGDAAWKPTGAGRIAVIDAGARQVVGSIELAGSNPFGRMVPVGGAGAGAGSTVTITMPGSFSAIDDGDAAAVVDLAGGAAKGLVRESELGGSVAEVVVAGPAEGYAIVAGTEPSNPTRVIRFDPTTGKATATLADSRADGGEGAYVHQGLALDGPHVLVGDRTWNAPAIHVFDRATGREVGSVRPERLPPVAILPLGP